MTVLRLLADDLTGALDSAARFVPLCGPIPVTWSLADRDGSFAIDTGTREVAPAEAIAAVTRHVNALAGADIAFKKIDSLLRGHVAAELSACMTGFDHCILAPAFPFQSRVTRAGRQMVRDGSDWHDVGVDLTGLPLHDAATDADLDAIVAAGRRLAGRVLWCGTGGLAGALAGRRPVPCPALHGPVLGLIGSNHPTTLAQLASVPDLHRIVPIGAAVGMPGPAAVTVGLPAAMDRVTAAALIAETLLAVLLRSERPGTLFVSGGETLRAICDGLGASSLLVDGEIEPGVPTSLLCGGSWDGLRIVSKSGAFGDAGFLARLFAAATDRPVRPLFGGQNPGL
jgi:uncharacterized protein YgbK (DUF1537 family)